MKKANVTVTARKVSSNTIEVKISNPFGNSLAFFNRVSLVDSATGKRVMPVFYDNNYVSVLPGSEKTVRMDYTGNIDAKVTVEGWNVTKQTVDIQK